MQYQRDKLIERALNVGSDEDPVGLARDFGAVNVDVEYHRNVHVVADGKRLPFRDKSFDTVILGDSIEHDVDPGAMVRDAARVARRRVVITVPMDTREDAEHFGHRCGVITGERLLAMTKAAGLETEEFFYVPYWAHDPATGYVLTGHCFSGRPP